MSAAKKLRELERMQAQCDAFNANHPVGSSVFVQLDGKDEPFATKTRSEAQILSGHTPVIWLDDVRGCYLLDRVTARQENDAATGASQ